MPELPDVEVFKRYLSRHALNQRVVAVECIERSLLRDGLSPRKLQGALIDTQLQRAYRRGKHLFARLDDGQWLELHFGMTGYLDYADAAETPPRHSRLVLELDNGKRLAYVNQRKLGRIGLVDDPDTYLDAEAVGPDILTLGESGFVELAGGRRGQLKCWLMDQSAMAGLGNIYSDEILFQARAHPKTPVKRLAAVQLAAIYRQVEAVCAKAVAAKADPERMPADFLLPHRRKDGRCPRCGAPLEALTACGRTAYRCPECQPDWEQS